MSKRIMTCVEWVCDDCGQRDGEDGEGTIHYPLDEPSPFETIDGKDVCEYCSNRRECAKVGHEMSTWKVVPLDGTGFRYCVRCWGVNEERDIEEDK